MNSVLREGGIGASFFCKHEWVGLTIEQLPELNRDTAMYSQN